VLAACVIAASAAATARETCRVPLDEIDELEAGLAMPVAGQTGRFTRDAEPERHRTPKSIAP